MGRRVVFLDFHGTLGDEGPGGVEGFSLYPFAAPAVRLLNQTGLLTILVTNQSRIAAGLFTGADFERRMDELGQELAGQGARLDAVYYCPHPAQDGCSCRKPARGMLLRAQKDWDLELTASYLVGDVGAWDMLLARAVSCRAILVRTGWGEGSLGQYRPLWVEMEPDFVAENVLEAAEWIVGRETGKVPSLLRTGGWFFGPCFSILAPRRYPCAGLQR